MKKDEIESLKSSLNKANEKIVSLQGDVEAYKLSGEQMGDEIKALKRQLGGFKKSNANYRKQVEQLKGQLEHYKGLYIDVDELYKKKIAECEELQKQLDMANLTIGELYDDIEYEQKPWWKKIF